MHINYTLVVSLRQPSLALEFLHGCQGTVIASLCLNLRSLPSSFAVKEFGGYLCAQKLTLGCMWFHSAARMPSFFGFPCPACKANTFALSVPTLFHSSINSPILLHFSPFGSIPFHPPSLPCLSTSFPALPSLSKASLSQD